MGPSVYNNPSHSLNSLRLSDAYIYQQNIALDNGSSPVRRQAII